MREPKEPVQSTAVVRTIDTPHEQGLLMPAVSGAYSRWLQQHTGFTRKGQCARIERCEKGGGEIDDHAVLSCTAGPAARDRFGFQDLDAQAAAREAATGGQPRRPSPDHYAIEHFQSSP